MDIDEEDASTEAALVPLGTLMDIDTSVELQQVPSVAAPTVVLESSTEKERARNPTEPYRRYTTHQIEQSCNYVIEQGKTAKDATFLSRINIRTAQCYGLEVQVNASKTTGFPKKFCDGHQIYLRRRELDFASACCCIFRRSAPSVN
jgi:hypothetical protein